MDDLDRLSYPMALAIGAFQVLSLIPGTSRSGATILGGILIDVPEQLRPNFPFSWEFR